jgi:hypothetical protein
MDPNKVSGGEKKNPIYPVISRFMLQVYMESFLKFIHENKVYLKKRTLDELYCYVLFIKQIVGGGNEIQCNHKPGFDVKEFFGENEIPEIFVSDPLKCKCQYINLKVNEALKKFDVANDIAKITKFVKIMLRTEGSDSEDEYLTESDFEENK